AAERAQQARAGGARARRRRSYQPGDRRAARPQQAHGQPARGEHSPQAGATVAGRRRFACGPARRRIARSSPSRARPPVGTFERSRNTAACLPSASNEAGCRGGGTQMRTQRSRKRWLAAVAALVAVVAAASAYGAWSGPEAEAAKSSTEVLRFDVAEDPTRFVFAPTPVDADGLPAYGNYFITQGYL